MAKDVDLFFWKLTEEVYYAPLNYDISKVYELWEKWKLQLKQFAQIVVTFTVYVWTWRFGLRWCDHCCMQFCNKRQLIVMIDGNN